MFGSAVDRATPARPRTRGRAPRGWALACGSGGFLLLALTAACAHSGRPVALPPTVSLPVVDGFPGEAAGAAEPAGLLPAPAAGSSFRRGGYRLGPDDELEVMVFEAPELNRTVRVSPGGEISLPLLGTVRAGGLTPQELQVSLEERLRSRYILDPHVSVQVTDIQSHPIAVVGAVNRPGVYQVRGPQTLVEVLALAGGLSEDAGSSALVVRGGSTSLLRRPPADGAPALPEVEEVALGVLLETGDARHNVAVYPGDVVKVTPAGVVYVVGEVRQPGVFPLSRYAGMTLMQAVALGEGLSPTAARGRALIIRTDPSGARTEIRVDLGRVLAGRATDPPLQPRDIVFVPNSAMRSVALGVIEALARMITLRAVF